MTRPQLEVADLLRRYGDDYRARYPLSPEQARVLTNLSRCRTAALGGHVDACAGCGYRRPSYNSCRDRHCPKCQAARRAAWVEARLERLLPVEYFHVVFTVPEQLHPFLLRSPRTLYGLLFRAAAATLLQLAADPRRLGAQVGFTAVLHTWGQTLCYHPHLHCVVTGGGLSPDGGRWVAAKGGYLLPVKIVARLFRGKFLAGLSAAVASGAVPLTAAEAEPFPALLDRLYRRDWVVYAKPPFGDAAQVYRYLGRYTHRVAVANSRLLALTDDRVSFQYKDYAAEGQSKVMTLAAVEFIRRFLLHVLPRGFVRIRHYGLLAGPSVATKLERCRWLLGPPPVVATAWVERLREWVEEVLPYCPRCGDVLMTVPLAAPDRPKAQVTGAPAATVTADTS